MILTGNFFSYQTSNKGSNIPRLSYPCKIVSWHPINKPVAISTKCYYRIQSNKRRNLYSAIFLHLKCSAYSREALNWQKVTCDWNYWHRIISMRSTDVNSRKLQGQGWSHYLKIIEFQRSTSFLIHCIEGVSHFTPLRAHLHITQQSLKVEPKDSRLRDSIRNQVKVSTVQWRPSMISFVKAILTSSMKWRNLSFWLEKAVF